MDPIKTILEHALKMKPSEKYLIIEGILKSLDEPDKTIDEIWAVEAEKRLTAFKTSNLKTVSYEDIFGENQEVK